MLKWVLRSDSGHLTRLPTPQPRTRAVLTGARRRVSTVWIMVTPAAIRLQAAAKVSGLLSVARLAQ